MSQYNTYTLPLVTKVKYATSWDERGYIPVKEYFINGHSILLDSEKGDICLTGIWKVLGYQKSEINKFIKLNPNIQLKKITGGNLKIQGTWISFYTARALCLRIAWDIRHQLVPLFGTEFVHECYSPYHPMYRAMALDWDMPTSMYSFHHLTTNHPQVNIPPIMMTLPYILNTGDYSGSTSLGDNHDDTDN
ncbi:transcription regulator HTH, apses-type DNA-binding domain-containing protein [Chlamydoabsidia padenii]|nr:transcription regulator HTH, apses-type DNA-binding domain-containing protein [Chlamydoabsidia padenii]